MTDKPSRQGPSGPARRAKSRKRSAFLDVGTAQGPVGGRAHWRERLTAWGMLLPSAVVFSLFFFYALYRLFWLGLHQQNRTGTRQRWIGWSQFSDTLAGDEFREGIWITVKFVLLTVPAGLILGVLLAVAANRQIRGIKIFQTIFSSTIATSAAVASVIFFVLINPEIGILNDASTGWNWFDQNVLDPVIAGISLEDPDTALRGVALSAIWQNLGLTFIITLAGLQAVPDELLEAATIDGYGAIRRFFHVTLPLLSPTLLFLVVALTIHGFQAFAQIDILTQGGPAQSTETLVFKIFRDSQTPTNLGPAAVMAVGLFVLSLLVTLTQFMLLERRVHYAD